MGAVMSFFRAIETFAFFWVKSEHIAGGLLGRWLLHVTPYLQMWEYFGYFPFLLPLWPRDGGELRAPRMVIMFDDDEVHKHIKGWAMHVVDWDPDVKRATACWAKGFHKDGTPKWDKHQACGYLYDFYPRCSGISSEDSGLVDPYHGEIWKNPRVWAQDGKEYPLDYWTPRGQVATQLPGKKEHRSDGLWIMETSPDTEAWDCRNMWYYDGFKAVGQIPQQLKENTEDEKELFEWIEEECEMRGKRCPDQRKRHDHQDLDLAYAELAGYFSSLPLVTSAQPHHDFAVKGADLIHSHFVAINTSAQMQTLDLVMSTILDSAQSRDLNRRMSAMFSASADALMHAVLDAMIAKAPNRERGYAVSAMGISSILRASRERLEAGERKTTDVDAFQATRRTFQRLFNEETFIFDPTKLKNGTKELDRSKALRSISL